MFCLLAFTVIWHYVTCFHYSLLTLIPSFPLHLNSSSTPVSRALLSSSLFSFFVSFVYWRSLLGLLTASIMEVATNFQNVAFQLVRSIVDAKIIVPEVRTYVRASDFFPLFLRCSPYLLKWHPPFLLFIHLHLSHAPLRVHLLRLYFILHSSFFALNYFLFSLVLTATAFNLIQILHSFYSAQVYDLITKLSEQIALSQRRGGEQYMTCHVVLCPPCRLLSTLHLPLLTSHLHFFYSYSLLSTLFIPPNVIILSPFYLLLTCTILR